MSKEKQIEEMAKCENCIHANVCVIRGFPSAFENTHWEKEPCDHYCKQSEGEWNQQMRPYDAFTEDVAPRAEWISVEERLPERNGRYLTHCKIEGQSLVCLLYYCNVGGFNEGTVTHWMPFPEPPQMKGGAE